MDSFFFSDVFYVYKNFKILTLSYFVCTCLAKGPGAVTDDDEARSVWILYGSLGEQRSYRGVLATPSLRPDHAVCIAPQESAMKN